MTTWDKLCIWAILVIDLFLKAIFWQPGAATLWGFAQLDLYFLGLIWLPIKALGWVFRL